jgi:hypothetical protein
VREVRRERHLEGGQVQVEEREIDRGDAECFEEEREGCEEQGDHGAEFERATRGQFEVVHK